ncbi:MAG: arylsulfotransferase family protein [Methylocystis sp.]|uniref:arylsulfotransferase family protein n=1 Tax=Methylocystis sp. TaxID=1911079 RepID=UPI003DA21A62
MTTKSVTKVLLAIIAAAFCSKGATASEQQPCGTKPYPSNTQFVTPDPILNSPQVWSFVSAPDLHPMRVSTSSFGSMVSPGRILLAPYAFSDDATYGQPGSLILDNDANPVWFRPLSSPNLMNTDFRVQRLSGKPVLTFWQGTLATPPAYTNVPAGSSEPLSCYYILDNSYRVISTITAQRGYTSDVHEFLLTPENTALLLATRAVPMNLSSFGGPANGYVQDFSVQEIDLWTNSLVFFWSALDHIPLANSYEPASSATSSGNVWDAYHLNSVGLTDNSDLLVSGRNTSTIYRISRKTGKFVWQLGGKQSNFTIENSANFSWQHDARFHANNLVSMFDDACCETSGEVPPGTPPSHGLFLKLNMSRMTAGLQREFYHNPNLNIASQGSTQSLENGNIFVGWGQSSYFSEYTAAGNNAANPALNTIYTGQMPGNNYSYRAFRQAWIGTPFYPPSVAVKSNGGQTTVYASWNGSTETRTWQVFSGKFPYLLALTRTAPKDGFETSISVSNADAYYQVKALDASGRVIGTSTIVHRE